MGMGRLSAANSLPHTVTLPRFAECILCKLFNLLCLLALCRLPFLACYHMGRCREVLFRSVVVTWPNAGATYHACMRVGQRKCTNQPPNRGHARDYTSPTPTARLVFGDLVMLVGVWLFGGGRWLVCWLWWGIGAKRGHCCLRTPPPRTGAR